jgi:hypothetical protein
MTNSGGSSVDEKLNDLECDIFIPTCAVEWRPPKIIGSAGSIWEIFEKTSNNSFVDSFIAARLKEEFIIFVVRIIFGFTTMSLNYFTQTAL